jgi:Flp pilus assembly protein TadD
MSGLSPSADDPRFDVDALMRQAKAEMDAEIAQFGEPLPTLADVAQAAYDHFGAGNDALDRGDYAKASEHLRLAVEAGIEEARCQLDEAVAWYHLNMPNTDPEGPEQ